MLYRFDIPVLDNANINGRGWALGYYAQFNF